METESAKTFEPSADQSALIAKHLNQDSTILDPYYGDTNIVLTQLAADRRAELVSDIEYNFSLALNKGSNYLGQAEINFYLETLPENDEELFLNSMAMAVCDLTINEELRTDAKYFTGQKIRLELKDLKQGWNVVSLRYFSPY